MVQVIERVKYNWFPSKYSNEYIPFWLVNIQFKVGYEFIWYKLMVVSQKVHFSVYLLWIGIFFYRILWVNGMQPQTDETTVCVDTELSSFINLIIVSVLLG